MKQKKVLYQTAANGMTVRIPADKYGQWKAGQQRKDNPGRKELSEGLRKLLKK